MRRSADGPAARSRRTALFAGGLLALTLAAYGPAPSLGFVWDDDDYVTENATLRSVDGLRRIWTEPGAVPQYYPLVHTTYWIEYRLWGLDPAGYHLVNVLLHGASACVLWALLRRLRLPGAWLAAAIFAVHPIHVESVAWITERKNVLSGFFYLLAFHLYVKDRPPDSERREGSPRLYAAATACYVAALLGKTVAASLPAAILLVLWWKRGRVRVADLVPLVPWFAIGVAASSITTWLERHHVGAEGEPWALSWVDRVLVAGRAVWFYLGKLGWPSNLTFNYPRWSLDVGTVAVLAYPVAALVLLAVLWGSRARLGRGPLTAALFFGGTLLPALGIVDVYPMRYAFVADHFAYLASLGPIVLVSALAATAANAAPRGASRKLHGAGATLLLLVLAVLTWRQTGVYRDAETLWRDTLDKNPRSSLAHNNLGIILRQRGDVASASDHYRKAIDSDPGNYEAMGNLANILQAQGATGQAIVLYERALSVAPRHASSLNGLGIALAARGDLAGAEESYRAAIRARPSMSEARFNLGNLLARQGRLEDAVAAYRDGLRLQPDVALAHLNMGTALFELGRRDEAARSFREALRLDPRLASAIGDSSAPPSVLDSR